MGAREFFTPLEVAIKTQSPTSNSFSRSVMGGVIASRRAAAFVNLSMAEGMVRNIPVGLSSARDLAVYRSSLRRDVLPTDRRFDGEVDDDSTSDGTSISAARRRTLLLLPWGVFVLALAMRGAKDDLGAKEVLQVTSTERTNAVCFIVK